MTSPPQTRTPTNPSMPITIQQRPPPPPGPSSSRQPNGLPAMQPFGRPSTSGAFAPQMQSPGLGLPPNMAGMPPQRPSSAMPHPAGQSNNFGMLGIGQPPPPSKSPNGQPALYNQGHMPPPGMTRPAYQPQQHAPMPMMNGLSPIGPSPRGLAPGQPLDSPSMAGPSTSMAALNLGSQRNIDAVPSAIGPSSGHQRRASGFDQNNGLSNLQPIGRPRASGSHASDPEDDGGPPSTSVSLRSPSPPPILGSAALLEDFEEDVGDTTPSSPSTRTNAFGSTPFSGSTWGSEGGIWGAAGSSTWEPPSATRATPLERCDIIRVCVQIHYNDSES